MHQPLGVCRDLALPEGQHGKPHLLQGGAAFGVALDVALELGLPVAGVGLGLEVAAAGGAPVPEASVDEHGEFGGSENDVWRPGEFSDVLSVSAQARLPQRLAQGPLRHGVGAAVGLHRLPRGFSDDEGVSESLVVVAHLGLWKGC